MRGFITLFPLKEVGLLELYVAIYLGTSKIYGKPIHFIEDHTYIKSVRYNIKKEFETTINIYGLPLKGGIVRKLTTLVCF